MAESAEKGCALEPAMAGIVHSLGFDWFTYGAGSPPTPTRETRAFVWTNLPESWIACYEEKAHVEVDPRVTRSVDHASGLLWDRHTFPETKRLREFFDDAAKYGVRSGIAVAVRTQAGGLAGFYLTSSRLRMDEVTRAAILERHGDILVLAYFVHALMMENAVDKPLPAPSTGAKLSPRELQCLRLVAKGLSSREIGEVLGVAERTVHFHIASVLTKLDAANRYQAVQLAISGGIVSV